jgi:hypothetical protein
MFSKQAGMYSIDDLLTKSQIKNGTEFETWFLAKNFGLAI